MTDYCTVANVEARIKGIIFATDTVIKRTEVEGFITGNSAVIDSRINTLYSVPVTGTVSLEIVKKICVYLTLAEIMPVIEQGLSKEDITTIDYIGRANDMLEKIESGETDLIDASKRTSSNFYNYNVTNSIEPVVEKDETQW